RGARFERVLQSRQILTHAGPQPIRGEEAVRQLAGVKLIFDFESVVADLVLNLLEAYEVKHFGPGCGPLLGVLNGGKLRGEELRVVLKLVQDVVWRLRRSHHSQRPVHWRQGHDHVLEYLIDVLNLGALERIREVREYVVADDN